MQRCPACNARLSAAPLCPRCGVDLGRILRSAHLAEAWLSVALQTLHADRADVATAAIQRALSYRQTPAARLIKAFLIQHQYRALYEQLHQQHWQEAHDIVARLRTLQGDNEALRRFDEMIAYAPASAAKTAFNSEPENI